MTCHKLDRENGSFPSPTIWRVFKPLLCKNHLSHFEQTSGFSLVLVTSCVFNWPLCNNALSRLQQENSYSPPWIFASLLTPCMTFCIWLITNVAGKWFPSRVDSFMCLSWMITNQWIFAVWARKWLLSCVDFVMSLQPLAFCKGLVLFFTGKWLLLCMGPFMFY